MNSQRGFILPSVMFISVFVFIIVLANTYTFQSSVQITDKVIENIKIETLFQMGLARFKNDYANLGYTTEEQTIEYEFPNGNTQITYLYMNENQILLNLNITTENQSKYTLTKQLHLNSTE
ncbi:hypothetical protein GMD78_01805 [Ornithinibacillus sp. L9]|uniref:ComG operon protein 7 n=1 Tax=Ornithinibacillus caprae TaxID=2678566 RepID=A0A6N8FC53_9BACI|nr:hypothetical protein [Ornithinibacillus caprae]MUK87133.1 hypothetical protein [Ornithinibacillus caprae]